MEGSDETKSVVSFGDGRSNRSGDHPAARVARHRRNAVIGSAPVVLSFADGQQRFRRKEMGITFQKALVVALGVIVGIKVAQMLGVSRFLSAAA